MKRTFGGVGRIARRKVLVVFYLLAILLPFALDHFVETAENLSGAWARPARFYQRITVGVTLSGFRRPRAHVVRLVTFDPAKEPAGILDHPCVGRSLEARLLLAIARAGPAVIVMDELFEADTCPLDDPGTAELREAVASVTGSGIPIVLGLDSLNRDDQMQQGVAKSRLLDYDELIAQPGLEFSASGSRLFYGHVRLESDSRRIPLSWQTYASQADFDAGKPRVEMPTLAFQVAKIYNPSPAFQARLYRLNARDEDPYTSLLGENEFIEYEALHLVCGGRGTMPPQDWKSCTPTNDGMDELRGHVVLIGDRADDDIQQSLLGAVPGYLLQANYIEGLLDDRVFFRVPWWIELMASLALLGAIESIFRLQRRFPARALGLAALMIVFSWLVSYATVHDYGYYISLWFPGSVALLGEAIVLLADRPPRRPFGGEGAPC